MLLSVNAMNAQKEGQTKKIDSSSFEQLILPYIENALNAVETGAQFVFDEAPDVIRQYVLFKAVEKWSGGLFGVLIFIIGVFIIPHRLTFKEEPEEGKYKQIMGGRWIKEAHYDISLEEGLYYTILPIATIVGTFITLRGLMDAIKVTFFPKLYLVETFIHLIK